MKTYSGAPDVNSCVARILEDYHAELDGVTVSALFVFDTQATEPVLTIAQTGSACRSANGMR